MAIRLNCIIALIIIPSCTLGEEKTSRPPSRPVRQIPAELNNIMQKEFINKAENRLTLNGTEGYQDRRTNFWLARDDATTESNLDPEIAASDDTAIDAMAENTQSIESEMEKVEMLDDSEWPNGYEMNELMFLTRNNCNLELQIVPSEDRKLKIQYENLKNGMSGTCQITLHGKNNIFLAVLVSNVELHEKGSEVLKVVTMNNHFNYTIREYRANEVNYPVILTDSDLVYLILVFNGKNPSPKTSGFNLEVFNYYKNENGMKLMLQDDDYHGYGNTNKDVENIFITTSVP